jgi:hypothetical protein
MRRFHVIFGLTLLVVFLLTGQYMDRYHNHLEFMPDGPRMMYRSRHIFILMSGLLHLGIGTYFSFRSTTARRALQIVGSILITVATVLFTVAFFYEPRLEGLRNQLTLPGTIMIAVGSLLHLFSGLRQRNAS